MKELVVECGECSEKEVNAAEDEFSRLSYGCSEEVLIGLWSAG